MESPESPSWELDLVIPLIDEIYPLGDLQGPIEDDSSNGFIDVTADNILRLNVQDTIGTVTLGENSLTVRGIKPDPIIEEIGPIELDDFGSDQAFQSLTLVEMLPILNSVPDGTTMEIISFGLTPVENDIGITGVDEAEMEQGIIRISVYNGFIDAPNSGIPITNLRIVLTDANSVQLGSAEFDRIGPDSTEVREIDLAGKSFVTPISSTTTGDSPGSPAFTVNSTSRNGRIIISIEFVPPFIVSSVTGDVPPINIEVMNSIPLLISGSTELISGRFRSNTEDLIISIENRLQIPLGATLILPNFIDSSLVTAESVVWDNILPGATELRTISLGGDSLTNPAGDVPLTEIEYIFQAVTLTSGSSSTVTKDDEVVLTIQLDTLRFQRWKANFDETIPTTETNIEDMPEGFAGINLEDVQLFINLENSISVPMSLDLNILGTNSIFGTSAELILRDAKIESPFLFSTEPESTVILFKKDSTCVTTSLKRECLSVGENDDIVDFFNILPDKIRISGEANLSGIGVVAIGQSMGGDYQLKVPFSFSLDSTVKFVPATLNTIAAFDEEQKEQIEKNILYAIVESQLTNGFPLSGTLSLLISEDSTDFDAHPDSLEVDTLLTLVLPDTDPENGIFIAFKRDSIFLDSSKIRIFSRGGVHYIKPLITLKSTDGEPRSVKPSDFIGIKSVMTFRVKINP
ncbi:MAG: hypothetical protein IH880_09235 [Candidatus Marinimicrobia bacterium]|nr:hypothetical protein [Candidatus Neomarinimicrobiota bacterium]